MVIAFVRTIVLYLFIIAGIRLMGKRQVGELEPSELVLALIIADLAAVPMQDFGIPLLAGVIPILTLLALSMLLSQLSLTSLRFRALACGTPSILIREGVLQQEAMRRNRYTLDELLEELRGQGITGVEEVKYAVLENSGRLSVLPWSRCQPPTAERLGLESEEDVTLPVILVNDGRLLRRNLEAQGRRVVAGINGDFYVVGSGVPVGLDLSVVLCGACEGDVVGCFCEICHNVGQLLLAFDVLLLLFFQEVDGGHSGACLWGYSVMGSGVYVAKWRRSRCSEWRYCLCCSGFS